MKNDHKKNGLATVHADKGWDGSQAAVVYHRRRRHGVSWRVGLDIANIVGSRFPLVVFANEILNEAADSIVSYVNPRN